MAIIGFTSGFSEADHLPESLTRQRGRFLAGGTQRLYRDFYRHTFIWPVNRTGGESAQVPSTYSASGRTHYLVSITPNFGYEALLGTITAVYEHDSGWYAGSV
jgi:hypothetical protein